MWSSGLDGAPKDDGVGTSKWVMHECVDSIISTYDGQLTTN